MAGVLQEPRAFGQEHSRYRDQGCRSQFSAGFHSLFEHLISSTLTFTSAQRERSSLCHESYEISTVASKEDEGDKIQMKYPAVKESSHMYGGEHHTLVWVIHLYRNRCIQAWCLGSRIKE